MERRKKGEEDRGIKRLAELTEKTGGNGK